MQTYRYIQRLDDEKVRLNFPEVIISIRIWRTVGYTSKDVAELLNVPLKTVNRLWNAKTADEHVEEILEFYS